MPMDGTTTIYALLAAAALLYAPSAWKALVNNYKLRSIPIIGSSGYWTSYAGVLRIFRHGPFMVREGYNKYRGSIFRFPLLSRWMILVTSPQMIDEIRTASDEYLSVAHAFREILHTDVTLGPDALGERYHVEVVKLPLTRNIGPKFADVQDEIITAFNDHIKLQGNEWSSVVAFPTIMDVVCRTSNRMFVGLPLCRNPDYLELNKNFTIDLVKTAILLSMFPRFLRPVVVRLFSNMRRNIERGYTHLAPIFRDRLNQEADLGKDKPNDALSWLIDYSNPEQSDEARIKTMVMRMLQINFAAIHTTTMSFTNVLYDLAAHPEYVQPMRDEVEAAIKEEGWSKSAIGKLKKLDSFVKESLRLSGMLAFTMQRKVMKDFTFSNGMTIPAGNMIGVPTSSHFDSEYFTDPDKFDGFRFEKLRNEEGMENKHQIVSLDLNYVLFGHGRHACPGRFFAANELKVMLAHVVMNYDVKMAGSGRPTNLVRGTSMVPDPTAKVMFRKRS